MFRRRPQDEIRVLAERHVVALAVDLGGRGDHDQLLLLVGVLEHHFGAVHVGLDRADRLLDDQLDADGRGEMKNDVAAVDELREERLVLDRVDEVFESAAALEMRDVFDGAGRQVVEDEHLVAAIEQRLGEMRADEPGAAGDQRAHVPPERWSAFTPRFATAATVSICRSLIAG